MALRQIGTYMDCQNVRNTSDYRKQEAVTVNSKCLSGATVHWEVPRPVMKPLYSCRYTPYKMPEKPNARIGKVQMIGNPQGGLCGPNGSILRQHLTYPHNGNAGFVKHNGTVHRYEEPTQFDWLLEDSIETKLKDVNVEFMEENLNVVNSVNSPSIADTSKTTEDDFSLSGLNFKELEQFNIADEDLELYLM